MQRPSKSALGIVSSLTPVSGRKETITGWRKPSPGMMEKSTMSAVATEATYGVVAAKAIDC